MNKTRGLVHIHLQPHFKSNVRIVVTAHILNKLTTSIPSRKSDYGSWSHLENLQIADPHFSSPGSIDMILGAEIYSQIIEEGIIKERPDAPIAQLCLIGSYPDSLSGDPQYWKHDNGVYQERVNGRYIVKLPFKLPPENLGNSKHKTMRLMTKLNNRFKIDAKYAQAYAKFLREYETLEHMSMIPPSQLKPSISFYLPYHGVWKETSVTTKLRVVFNGSSKPDYGFWILNELLYTGPKLQTELFNVLLWCRQFHHVFTSDVEKMYIQIKVHPDHWDFQRILWMVSQIKSTLVSLLAKDGILWKFNPPCAPHFGGKWEAGVKSVKYHLHRVLGESLLTYEELSTLLIQVEAILFPNNKINYILDVFNSYNDRVKFTCDQNYDGSINFLDVIVKVEEGYIKIDYYKKPTDFGRYLTFYSNHPLDHKRGVIIGLLDRIILLSHPEFHNKNIETMINTLLNNGYPLDLIFITINKRIKSLSRKNLYKNFKIAYKPMNKLNSIIKTGKDKFNKMELCNVVYKINCLSCESSYVGQTKRKVRTRVKEHKSNTTSSISLHSVVAQHQVNFNHKFNWDDIEILDTEPFFNKRLTSEMIFIKKQIHSINKQNDTEKLPESYFPLLKISSFT
ncbi:hypothetical protein ALC57_07763 [Trachymyrmex cornetzi]|uniref:Helix-turn-helix domain-containing protein n=1 Tax=Trachymyrmex cornetzi TaxID=471704 RepID=A0A195E516_9HYME|nr:hypothetical protein ALC57_07763 [Trachymyrmex cornetzi]